MELSNKIQLASIIVSSLISIASIIIAILTLKQTNKITEESNRANIVFFISKCRVSSDYRLVIKNFGKSGGKLISITLDPKLSYKKIGYKFKRQILTECENIYLAPNQSISSHFPFTNYPDKKFNVKIKYETLGKIYTESYNLNLDFAKASIDSSPKINNDVKALEAIYHSILEVSDKLN